MPDPPPAEIESFSLEHHHERSVEAAAWVLGKTPGDLRAFRPEKPGRRK